MQPYQQFLFCVFEVDLQLLKVNDFLTHKHFLQQVCHSLEFLNLAECPVDRLPEVDDLSNVPTCLHSLNVSTTKINSWNEVEKLRNFPGLNDLRIQGCPFLEGYTAYEKRMMLIARLPNVKVNSRLVRYLES